MKKLLVFLVVSIFSCAANAASFDCAKAKTFIEKAICGNQVLSSLDDELGVVFAQARARAGNSDEFKTIARGNFALRASCKNVACVETWLRNSINLYNYLNINLPPDEMKDYPDKVRQACAGEQVATVDIVDCANAKTAFHEAQSQAILQQILGMKTSQEHKTQATELFARGKKDADYYCGIASNVEGTIANIIAADCYLSWAKRIQDLLATQQQTWEDEADMDETPTSPASNPN